MNYSKRNPGSVHDFLLFTSAPATTSSRAESRGFYKDLTSSFLTDFLQLEDLQSFYKCNIYTETSCYGVQRLVNVLGREQKFHYLLWYSWRVTRGKYRKSVRNSPGQVVK